LKAKGPGRLGAQQFRDSREQFTRVRVLGLMAHLFRAADFQELTGVHNGDARGDLRYYRQTVGGENVSQREFALEFSQQQKSSPPPSAAPPSIRALRAKRSCGHLRDENGKVKLEIGGRLS
jgi:hypothetical protein